MPTDVNDRALHELIDIVEALSVELEAGHSAPAALQRLSLHHNAVIRAHLCGRKRQLQPQPRSLAPAAVVHRCREHLAARRLNNEIACILVAVEACSTNRHSPAIALRWLAGNWRLRQQRT